MPPELLRDKLRPPGTSQPNILCLFVYHTLLCPSRSISKSCPPNLPPLSGSQLSSAHRLSSSSLVFFNPIQSKTGPLCYRCNCCTFSASPYPHAYHAYSLSQRPITSVRRIINFRSGLLQPSSFKTTSLCLLLYLSLTPGGPPFSIQRIRVCWQQDRFIVPVPVPAHFGNPAVHRLCMFAFLARPYYPICSSHSCCTSSTQTV